MLYLLIGWDATEKQEQFQKICQEFLPAKLRSFNLDILDTQEDNFSLRVLQERLLQLPFNAKHRIVLVHNSDGLTQEEEDFIIAWVKKKENKKTILVLDFLEEKKLPFINKVKKFSRIFRVKEEDSGNVFKIADNINSRQIHHALGILHDLIEAGEKPEKILGGLRYSLLNPRTRKDLLKRRLKVFLTCDKEIKTGKIDPQFALEKLVVALGNLV